MSNKAHKAEASMEAEAPQAKPKFKVTATVNELVDIYTNKYLVGVPVEVAEVTGWMESQVQANLMAVEEIK